MWGGGLLGIAWQRGGLYLLWGVLWAAFVSHHSEAGRSSVLWPLATVWHLLAEAG